MDREQLVTLFRKERSMTNWKSVAWHRVCRVPLAAALAVTVLLSLASSTQAQIRRRQRPMPATNNPATAAQTSAIEVTGELGSPSATTTISGKQLPPPDPKFGGVIGDTARQSKAWWPPRVVPPKGAPNVLL